MEHSFERHHVTENIKMPQLGVGPAAPLVRALPVDTVYDLKTRATPDQVVPRNTYAPKTSRRSMFFRGKSRSIKDDPFLERLSRLK